MCPNGHIGGKECSRHENVSNMGCVFVSGQGGVQDTANVPKWACWWEGRQPDTKMCPISDAFSCLACKKGEGNEKHDEHTDFGMFITFNRKDMVSCVCEEGRRG